MKDYLMNELKVGDRVVYTRLINNSAYLSFGRVNGFTNKKVRIGATTVNPDKIIKIIVDYTKLNGVMGAANHSEEVV